MKQTQRTRKLVEAALLVALSTVLSIFKIADLPYGGSITLASMLPVVLLAYRHGTRWGLGGGLAHGVLQQLLGLSTLSYFTTWQSILAIIVLDYLLAFALLGLGGVFRRVIARQNLALALGGATVSVLRYICHVISGATVWAGLSIPTEAALAYSLGYNATYMIPEAIVLVATAYYLGSVIDFRKENPVRLVNEKTAAGTADLSLVAAGLLAFGAIVADVSLVFARLQNEETGEFDVTGLAAEKFTQSVWLPVLIVSAVCGALIAVLLLCRRHRAKKQETQRQEAR